MVKSVRHRKSTARSSKVRKSPRKTKKVVRRKRKSTSSKRKKRKTSKKRKTRGKKVMKGGRYSVAAGMEKFEKSTMHEYPDKYMTTIEKFDLLIIIIMKLFAKPSVKSFRDFLLKSCETLAADFIAKYSSEELGKFILTNLDARLEEHNDEIDSKYHYKLLTLLKKKLLFNPTLEQNTLFNAKLEQFKPYSLQGPVSPPRPEIPLIPGSTVEEALAQPPQLSATEP
jgi:hypothetical protein